MMPERIAGGLTLRSGEPELARPRLAASIAGLRIALSDYLAGSAKSVSGRLPPPSLESVDAALLAFRHALDELRRSGTLRQLDTETSFL
jgi:hypothetical protein